MKIPYFIVKQILYRGMMSIIKNKYGEDRMCVGVSVGVSVEGNRFGGVCFVWVGLVFLVCFLLVWLF